MAAEAIAPISYAALVEQDRINIASAEATSMSSSIVALKRRELLIGATAAALIPALPALAARRTVTPGQTEGPFYPVAFPADMDNDLVRVQGRAAQALGQVTHVVGRVLNARGEPVRGATLEIWQCDANGIYNHPGQPGLQRRDAAFQGYGRTQAADDGRYSFRTIRPVAYPGRTPHIHFKVQAPGAGRLTTQMYIAGERQNATDGLLNSIRSAAARESVIVRLERADAIEPGALQGNFDIVLDL
ncbi:MAG TPA: protocatechuate 3,4-dioxygenase [Dongiaceae bacterium]